MCILPLLPVAENSVRGTVKITYGAFSVASVSWWPADILSASAPSALHYGREVSSILLDPSLSPNPLDSLSSPCLAATEQELVLPFLSAVQSGDLQPFCSVILPVRNCSGSKGAGPSLFWVGELKLQDGFTAICYIILRKANSN